MGIDGEYFSGADDEEKESADEKPNQNCGGGRLSSDEATHN
jgi:hypothetical protein